MAIFTAPRPRSALAHKAFPLPLIIAVVLCSRGLARRPLFVAFSNRGGGGLVADISCSQAVIGGIDDFSVALSPVVFLFAVLNMGDSHVQREVLLKDFHALILRVIELSGAFIVSRSLNEAWRVVAQISEAARPLTPAQLRQVIAFCLARLSWRGI